MSKIIRDLIYGNIELNENDLKVIDTPNFQRLKDVSHLKADCLYPSATHTRFEHSLGTTHLAMKFFDTIQTDITTHLSQYMRDVQHLDENTANQTVSNLINYYKTHLRYASLLHDVGQAPLSYLGEAFYNVDEIHEKINDVITQRELHLNDPSFLYNSAIDVQKKMSCYIILSKYYDILQDIMSDANFDIEFLLRIVTGARYFYGPKWIEDNVIEVLNSSSADANKVDSLLRDNFMMGNIATPINIDAFISSPRIDLNSHHMVFDRCEWPVLNNIEQTANELYFKVYNHHAVVYTEHITKSLLNNMFDTNTRKKYDDKVDKDAYFSCEAIADSLISDSDIQSLIKSKCNSAVDGNVSPYGQVLFTQLFERKYLKPAWESSLEFNNNILSRIENTDLRNEIAYDLSSEEGQVYRDRIVESIISKSKKKLKVGDVFLVKRSNRFKNMLGGMAFADSGNNWWNTQANLGNNPQDASSYLFFKNEYKDIVESTFLDVVTNKEYKW